MAIVYGNKSVTDAVPSLDLRFSYRKDLVDTISGKNLISFSRSSSGTYFDSTGTLQSAATNQARFDHDPATGESLGLLVEEERTNVITRSEELTSLDGTTGWFAQAANIFPNTAVAPDGTITANKLAQIRAYNDGRVLVAPYGAQTVGIGTTNPQAKMDVRGDLRVGINTSQGLILTSPNGTTFRLVVDDSGNLTAISTTL